MPQRATTIKTVRLNKSSALPVIIQKNKKLSLSYVLFLLVYTLFTLLPQPPVEVLVRYHLSVTGVRFIYLTIIVIIALIWGVGFYGFARLKDYAQLISKQKDGQHVRTLCIGIFLLAMWLPVTENISAILNFFATHHPKLLLSVTIFDNYLSLAIPLVAFICIGVGARGLNVLVKRGLPYYVTSLLALAVVYIGLIYAHLVAITPDREAVYHMSLWLILLTIVAPYMFMWFTGIVATLEIYNYQHKVSGVIYKRSWGVLALGCGWLIATSIVFQFLTTLSAHLTSLSIYWLLAIIYGLLAILSVGFIFIALGTRRLQRIEEI